MYQPTFQKTREYSPKELELRERLKELLKWRINKKEYRRLLTKIHDGEIDAVEKLVEKYERKAIEKPQKTDHIGVERAQISKEATAISREQPKRVSFSIRNRFDIDLHRHFYNLRYSLRRHKLAIVALLFLIVVWAYPSETLSFAKKGFLLFSAIVKSIPASISVFIETFKEKSQVSTPIPTPPVVTTIPPHTLPPVKTAKMPSGYNKIEPILESEYEENFPPKPSGYVGGNKAVYGEGKVYIHEFQNSNITYDFLNSVWGRYTRIEDVPKRKSIGKIIAYARFSGKNYLGTFFQLDKVFYHVKLGNELNDEKFIVQNFIDLKPAATSPPITSPPVLPVNVKYLIEHFPGQDYNNPYLKAHVKTLTKDCSTYDKECKLYKIYKYVIENFDYRYEPGKLSYQAPSQTLERGYGVCIDFAILFYNYLTAAEVTTYVVDCDEDQHAYVVACNIEINTLRRYIATDLQKLSGRYVIPDLEFEINKAFGKECLHLEGPSSGKKDEITILMEYPGRYAEYYIDPRTNVKSRLMGARYVFDPQTKKWERFGNESIKIITKKPFG